MFNSNLKQYKYFLYARKSSESEDRQVQSIDDQIMFLTKKYPQAQIIHTFKESRSAKIRNNRPEFNEMIERVEANEVDGIICWELNRLSRNAEEAGIIMGLLQRFQLTQILNYDKSYLPEDNVLLMFVGFGISTQYSKDLSKNVKRGFQGKYERGEFPQLARVGYINNKEDHTIDPDPERFEIVREM